MENKIDDKELEKMLNDKGFMKMVNEKVKNGEIQLDDMEGVIGGMTPEQLRDKIAKNPDKYKKQITKVVAMTVALSMALAVGSGVDSTASGKKPKLNMTKKVISVGDKVTLKVKKNGNRISKVTWKSTKPEVAGVSAKGVVTAERSGSTQIKASFKIKGTNRKTTLKCKITVKDNTIKDWKTVSDPRLNLPNIELDKAIEAFVTSELDGIKCEPCALLAKSKSSENYRVLCRITPVVPDAKGYYAIVEVGLDKEMNVESYNTIATSREIYGALPKEPGDVPLAGGMIQAEDPMINEVQKGLIEPCLSNLGDYVNKYVPIAILGTQVVNGTEFLTVCEREVWDDIAYFLVNVVVDSAGKASVGNIYPFTLQAEDYSVATDLDPNVVEAEIAGIRNAIAAGAWGDVAAKISYPLTFLDKAAGKDVTVKSEKEFLALDYVKDPTKMDQTFLSEVIGDSCTQLRPNSYGFMLGENGEIWLNEVSGKIKITAINGITGM